MASHSTNSQEQFDRQGGAVTSLVATGSNSTQAVESHPCSAGGRIMQVCENATYQDVLDAPDHKVAELLHGKLYLMSRPAGPHAYAASMLGGLLIPPFKRGKGGPGGWHLLDEPELHLIRDTKVVVPDLAGWLLESMPKIPQDHKFTQKPDWVCEVLSPSTFKTDWDLKIPEYAAAGIKHLWVVDPLAQDLKAFELIAGEWVLLACLKDDAQVCVPPYDAITFSLSELWP